MILSTEEVVYISATLLLFATALTLMVAPLVHSVEYSTIAAAFTSTSSLAIDHPGAHVTVATPPLLLGTVQVLNATYSLEVLVNGSTVLEVRGSTPIVRYTPRIGVLAPIQQVPLRTRPLLVNETLHPVIWGSTSLNLGVVPTVRVLWIIVENSTTPCIVITAPRFTRLHKSSSTTLSITCRSVVYRVYTLRAPATVEIRVLHSELGVDHLYLNVSSSTLAIVVRITDVEVM